MSLLIIALVAVTWAILCALVVAICASAKEGDGIEGSLATPGEFGAERRIVRPSLARR